MNHKRPAIAAAEFAFEKNTLSIKQYVVVAMEYKNKKNQIVVQSEFVNMETSTFFNQLTFSGKKNIRMFKLLIQRNEMFNGFMYVPTLNKITINDIEIINKIMVRTNHPVQ